MHKTWAQYSVLGNNYSPFQRPASISVRDCKCRETNRPSTSHFSISTLSKRAKNKHAVCLFFCFLLIGYKYCCKTLDKNVREGYYLTVYSTFSPLLKGWQWFSDSIPPRVSQLYYENTNTQQERIKQIWYNNTAFVKVADLLIFSLFTRRTLEIFHFCSISAFSADFHCSCLATEKGRVELVKSSVWARHQHQLRYLFYIHQVSRWQWVILHWTTRT